MDDLFDDVTSNDKKEEATVATKKDNEKMSLEEIDTDDAPMLPMNDEPEEEYDLQKELEAKFDELFGPIDDDE